MTRRHDAPPLAVDVASHHHHPGAHLSPQTSITIQLFVPHPSFLQFHLILLAGSPSFPVSIVSVSAMSEGAGVAPQYKGSWSSFLKVRGQTKLPSNRG